MPFCKQETISISFVYVSTINAMAPLATQLTVLPNYFSFLVRDGENSYMTRIVLNTDYFRRLVTVCCKYY